MADLGVAVEFRDVAADQDCRVCARLLQDEGYHRCGSSLAVGSGYGYAGAVLAHEGAEGFSPGNYRDALFFAGQDLRVLRGDR